MTEVKTMGRDMENLINWQKENIRRYTFNINKKNEKEVYEYFENMPNKREYIIELIKKDMVNNKK